MCAFILYIHFIIGKYRFAMLLVSAFCIFFAVFAMYFFNNADGGGGEGGNAIICILGAPN